MLRMSALATVVVAALAADAAPAFKPVDLRCEYRLNPLGIDVEQPRLSWRLEAATPQTRGIAQAGWRVLAATSPALLEAGKADLWDSGRQAGSRTIQIVYAGKPLTSTMHVFWKAASFDAAGASAWSDPAEWSMGILRPAEWNAQWIGREEVSLYKHPDSPTRQLEAAQWIAGGTNFTTTLRVPAGIVRARAVFAADNSFELSINGERIGKGTFVNMPQVFEVQPFLKPGDNRVEVIAKKGNGPAAKLIGSIRLETASGSSSSLVTSAAWQTGGKAAEVLGAAGTAPWGELGYSEERVLPARYLRKEFESAKPVKRATAYVAGLGLYEMYVNGRRVGDDVLQPNLSEYDKRVYYNTHDITALVRSGANAVGVVLGNGRYWAPRYLVPAPIRSYGTPRLLARIEIEHQDGTRTVVVSNGSWRLTTNGPIRANNEFDGEELRRAPGHARLGRTRLRLLEMGVRANGDRRPAGILAAQMAEPLRVTETLKPVKKSAAAVRASGSIDMGQNMVGWCRLNVPLARAAPASPCATPKRSTRAARSTSTTCARHAPPTSTSLEAAALETWEPRFTYHGFRYVEVTGYPGEPPIATPSKAAWSTTTCSAPATSNPPTRCSTSSTATSSGAFAATTAASPPTARSATSARAGSATAPSSAGANPTCSTSRPSTPSGCSDIETRRTPTAASPMSCPPTGPCTTTTSPGPAPSCSCRSMLHDQYGDTRVIERTTPP